MSLIDSFKVDCVKMIEVRTPDGEGGYVDVWSEGNTFQAAIVYDNSLENQIAQKYGVSSAYTITTDKGINLTYHDVIKRISDGKYFLLTNNSEDKNTPSVATFSFTQFTAEEWSIPQ